MTMMPTEISTAVTSPADGSQLSELLLRVARRADELARRSVVSRATDRWLWLRAEFEVFELLGRKLDFQGDRIREGFKGRVTGGNGIGPL